MMAILLEDLEDEDALLILEAQQNDAEKNNMMTNKPPKLDFSKLTDAECLKRFRFNRAGLTLLQEHLHIPEKYVCPNRTTATGLEGLLVLLRRLTYPNRLCELVHEFGRSKTELSLIFNTVLEDIYERFHLKLTDLTSQWIDLQRFSAAVTDKGSPVTNCWGFVDGTCMFVCRPTYGQKSCYSGHKRQHCVKFQGVMSPCGLMAHLFGPVEGCRHDSFMLGESKLLDSLSQGDLQNYCLYGDPAYPIRAQLLAPYRGDVANDQNVFNKEMSRVRQSVEWGFGKVTTNFAFLDFKKNLKLLLQPVSKYYVVGVFLMNCHTCIYGSQTSSYFDCEPPSLTEYLQ